MSNSLGCMDCISPVTSANRLLQARIQESVTISYSRWFFWPRNSSSGSDEESDPDSSSLASSTRPFVCVCVCVCVCVYVHERYLKTKDQSLISQYVRYCHFNSVQSLNRIWLFVTPRSSAWQASLSITNFWSLLKLMSIELVVTPNSFIIYHPLLLLSSIFPSITVFSNEFFASCGQSTGFSASASVLLEWIFRTDFH